MRNHPTARKDSRWDQWPRASYRWDSPAFLIYLGGCGVGDRRHSMLSYPILTPLDLNQTFQDREDHFRTGVPDAQHAICHPRSTREFVIIQAPFSTASVHFIQARHSQHSQSSCLLHPGFPSQTAHLTVGDLRRAHWTLFANLKSSTLTARSMAFPAWSHRALCPPEMFPKVYITGTEHEHPRAPEPYFWPLSS